MTRIRLLARCQINGSLHEPGDIVVLPDGQRGPHRTKVANNYGGQIATNRYTGDTDPDANYAQQDIYDEPLFVVVDEGIEREREEMLARHAEEEAKLDHHRARRDLITKQAKERSELETRAQETELQARHKREAEALKTRQEAEAKAFDKRAETAPLVPPPIETDKEGLQARHKAEDEAQKQRQTEEQRVLDARKEQQQAREKAAEHPDRVEKPADAKPEGVKPFDPVSDPKPTYVGPAGETAPSKAFLLDPPPAAPPNPAPPNMPNAV